MQPRLPDSVTLRLRKATLHRAEHALRLDRAAHSHGAMRGALYNTTRSDILRHAIDLGLDALIALHAKPNPSRGMIKT